MSGGGARGASGRHRVGPTTRVFALLGHPVAHSLSPAIQNAAFDAEALDAVYVALDCAADDVGGLLIGLSRAGGGGNITVPYKARSLAYLERSTDAVRHSGACNTFWFERGRICGDNTDVAGFREAAEALLGRCAGARTLLIGAGGAARAAALALVRAGAPDLAILNRTPARALELIERLVPAGLRAVRMAEADLEREQFDLVVNATSLGLEADDALPLDLTRVRRVGAALDLVYRAQGVTRWTRHAVELGIPAADGLRMLLAQGAAAFRCWYGRSAPMDAMRSALQPPIVDRDPSGHGVAPIWTDI